MRIVSLVPSWTETLIENGCEVVGRTRFCIHPKVPVKSIPIVGGTKDWHWERILALKPDVLVLDREENPKFMADQTEIPVVDTHVQSITDLPREVLKLSKVCPSGRLDEMALAWEKVLALKPLSRWDGESDFPGLLEWGRTPGTEIKRIEYVIWKEPWMGVSKDTFIGSVLEHCGFKRLVPQYAVKYPKLELNDAEKESTLLLFSSEPFPFLRIKNSLAELGYPFALVNGESFSWFGVRSLRFLEGIHGIHSP
jgi:hypothetical protein